MNPPKKEIRGRVGGRVNDLYTIVNKWEYLSFGMHSMGSYTCTYHACHLCVHASPWLLFPS